ncbi:MAG TPA: TIGR03118 family protein [Vicinamibacterales bacterium]|nr:TIGR03118 family protein [Vicinamibacterales bacterium]
MRTVAMVAVCLIAAAGSATTTDQGNRFVQTILVANKASFHPQMVNPDMINPWGIAVRPPGAGGHFWINNAGTGTSVEYIGDVNGVALFQDGLKSVTLDAPRFTDHGVPTVTGLAYNAASDIPGQPIEFPVSGPAGNYSTTPSTPVPGGTSGSAKFVFVTEDGAINAWRLNTATAMTSAPLVVDYSKTARFPYAANCVFSGVAMTVNASTSAAFAAAGGNRLFATDFRNNAIEVFSNQWKDVTSSFHFQTPSSIGALHPFNIAALDGHLYVAYAMFDPAGDEGMEEQVGAGYGHVVEYTEDGRLVRDFNDSGTLNAPWGMAIAPAGFGEFGGALLVANLGDGTIAALDRRTGRFIDYMRDETGKTISIERIWGLVFGNGVSLGDAHALYFTAAPNDEYDGIFGRLTALPASVRP